MGVNNFEVARRYMQDPAAEILMKLEKVIKFMKWMEKLRPTEDDWRAEDKFWKEAAPFWFKLLNWVIILSVIKFLTDLTKDQILNAIYLASYFFLLSKISKK